jgi:hypothetical protein
MFTNGRGLLSSAAMLVALSTGILWHLRNRYALPMLSELARRAGARRIAATLWAVRWWVLLNLVLIAPIILADAILTRGSFVAAIIPALGLSQLGWLAAWPVFLIILLVSLRRSEKTARAHPIRLLDPDPPHAPPTIH